jgi:hypothetical protein
MTDNTSPFTATNGRFKLRESFNRPAAIYLQKNLGDFMTDPAKLAKGQEVLDKLIEKSRGRSFINVTYDKAKSGKGRKSHGRFFAVTPAQTILLVSNS